MRPRLTPAQDAARLRRNLLALLPAALLQTPPTGPVVDRGHSYVTAA